MKKYITRRQRQALWVKKRWKTDIVICAVCLIGLIFGFRFHYESTRSYGVYEKGSESSVCSEDKYIPEYDGRDYIEINDGIPNFNAWDLENIKGENYSQLDRLGRCGVACARLDKSMMPTGERGNIGNIKPTGWCQKKYEGVVNSNPPYLYNRCHLIAYALTGQNENERNLITGTRYMNVSIMLPWEEKVMKYLDCSDNHVLYRVTPYFKGTELLARGVEMEAYSLEDNGQGICFHVFVYNIQPGIEIHYSTGESWKEK